MGIFQKLFNRENCIEPFPENQSDAEKLDWFKKTQPWDKINEKIINAIISKYNGNPMIVVFVVVSMNNNLVPTYCKYNDSEYLDSPDLMCSFIAKIIYDVGSGSLKQLIFLLDKIPSNQEKFKLHYSTVIDSLESCIILDENQVSAYSGLATAKSVINKPDETIRYAQQGLNKLNQIKNRAPFHLSDNENIKNANQTFDEIENHLNQLIIDSKT